MCILIFCLIYLKSPPRTPMDTVPAAAGAAFQRSVTPPPLPRYQDQLLHQARRGPPCGPSLCHFRHRVRTQLRATLTGITLGFSWADFQEPIIRREHCSMRLQAKARQLPTPFADGRDDDSVETMVIRGSTDSGDRQ